MEDFSPSKKIGIKLLDKPQLNTSFPQFEDLCRRIELQRTRAAQQDERKLLEREYFLIHDNIFGIFGGRGSGKTSVLFSMRERFLRDAEETGDVVLPVVLPEIISEDCTLLGWVLAMFDEELTKIEDTMKRHEEGFYGQAYSKNPGEDFFEGCRYKQQNPLRQDYEQVYRECFSITRNSDYSYGDALSIKADESRRHFQLLRALNKFWMHLIHEKQDICSQKRHSSYGDKQQPLIFIMFDDIDLAPERSMELLVSAFKYFSNPNVVVVITADIDVLKRVLDCKMYEKVVGSRFASLLQGQDSSTPYELKSAQEAATEYLNKVVPPSSRYYLEKYQSSEQKKLFRYPDDRSERSVQPGDIEDVHSKGIEEFLLLVFQDFPRSGARRFLLRPDCENLKDEGEVLREGFLSSYLLIFGSKNRSISNGCLEIMNAAEELGQLWEKGDSPERIHQIYYILNHLLNVLLSSSKSLGAYQQYTGQLLSYHKGALYLNQPFVLELYDRARAGIELEVAGELQNKRDVMEEVFLEQLLDRTITFKLAELKRTIGRLFLVLYFIENLRELMSREENLTFHLHGGDSFLALLNRDTLNTRVYQNTFWEGQMRLFRRLQAKQMIFSYLPALENPEHFVHFNPYNLSDINAYFSLLYERGSGIEMSLKYLLEAHEEDMQWCKTVLSLLFIRESGILVIPQDFFHAYDTLATAFKSWRVAVRLTDSLRDSLRELMSQNQLLYYSKQKLAKFYSELWDYFNRKSEVQRQAPRDSGGRARQEATDIFTMEDENELDALYQMAMPQIEPYRGLLMQEARQLLEDMRVKKINTKEQYAQFSTHLITLVNVQIQSCIGALGRIHFYASWDLDQDEDMENMEENLDIISDAVPEVANRVFDIKNKLSHGEEPREISFEVYKWVVSKVMVALDNHSTGYYPIGVVQEAFYEIRRHIKIRAEKKFHHELSSLVLRLRLLDFLAPYYVAARFSSDYVPFEQAREDTINSQINKALGTLYTQVIRFPDTAIYNDSASTRGVLFVQTFNQIKDAVANDYMVRLEAGNE